ncbi:MAG: ABC transporter permease, partial [Sciscionella sp.]
MTTTVRDSDSTGVTGAGTGSPVAAPESEKAITRGRLVLRRFARNKLALVGAAVVVLLYVMAFSYPLYAPWSYTDHDYTAFLAPPSGSHWFGTDKTGVDMYTQTMRGLQKSLTIGLLVGVFSTGFATIVGATAGYFRGWTDRMLMWLVDLLLVLPPFLILAVVS